MDDRRRATYRGPEGTAWPSPATTRRIKRRDLLAAALLVAFTLWQFLPAVAKTPFHRDEARWVHRVYYLREWRDPFGPRWQDEGYPTGEGSWDERYRMRDQPPLVPYVFGLGLLLQGRDLTTNGFWNMERDDGWNEARGNRPAAADLRAARRTNAVIGALIVVAAYSLGKRFTNRVGGAVGALILAIHPLLLDVATRAWTDATMVLLVALAAIAAGRLGDRPTWRRALLLGALLGLGGAAKLSPLLVAVSVGVLGALLLVLARCARGGRPDDAALGWRLLAVPAVAAVVFVAAYPYLWANPIEHGYSLFAFRVDSFASQGRSWPNAAVDSRTEALRRVGAQLSVGSSAGGRIAAEAGQAGIPVGTWSRDADLLAAVAGAIALVARAVGRGPRNGCALAALVLGAQAAVTVLAMGVDYARYHLPILLLVAVCAGVAAGHGWAMARRLVAPGPLPGPAPSLAALDR